MLGLRLAEGVDAARLRALGDQEGRWRGTARALARDGLVEEDGRGVRLTRAGRALQDAVTVRLLPD